MIPDTLTIDSSAYSDPDGDAHAVSELEIWRFLGDVRVERVWHATVMYPPKLTSVVLADGDFEGSASGTGLDEWTDYGVRVRYQDARAGGCGAWSAWSADLVFKTDDGSTYLYDPSLIHDFYLDIPPASWAAINAEAIPPGCVPFHREYYAGTLTFEGQVFDDVGIHTKGGCGSARDLNGKAAFKVNIDWDDPNVAGCPDSRRLLGQKHLTLNNNVQDATMAHERVGYDYYKLMGVPTPRASTARLFVNGEFWGVYTLVETIDRRFVDRWFGSKEGMLYEGTYWCDLIPSNVPPGLNDGWCLEREFSPSPCSSSPPGADPMDYELLRQLTLAIEAMPPGTFYDNIGGIFEFDTFLSQWAADAMMGHWDGFEFSIMNNYRVYHDPSTGRWSMIPTGIDQTFGSDVDPWGVYGVLARRCLEEAPCEAAFAARLHEAATVFTTSGLPTEASAIQTQIAPDVYNDPRREYGYDTFVWASSDFVNWIGSRPPRINQYLVAHGF